MRNYGFGAVMEITFKSCTRLAWKIEKLVVEVVK